MTDKEIINAFEYCPQANACTHAECPLFGSALTVTECAAELNGKVLDLIQRQQAKIEELTDRVAIRAIGKIHYNIAELNLIKTGFDIVEIKRRFRAEFEEKMELGIDDCINWADWLDSIVSELLEEAKEGASDDR